MVAIATPDWVKHAVFYQIFPDSFVRGEAPPRQPGEPYIPHPSSQYLEPWDAPPSFQRSKGGNLWGVCDRLDYLQDLGINALYLNPVFQSASNHGYHPQDYYQVDPILGGNKALMTLLEKAHDRNIRVILDGVFNHASRGFYYFNDILENGGNSPWLDWFQVEDWPLAPYDGSRPANYKSWVDYRALPQFNHHNSEVREYLMGVGEYWIAQGFDGWRLDVPFCVTAPGFWQEFRDRIKAINSEAYIVGEVWSNCQQWLDGTQFDGVMNYLFTGPTLAFAAGDRVVRNLVEGPDYLPYPALDAKGYSQAISELLALYPWEIQLTQLNLLDSHDTARVRSVVNGDGASVELATLLMLTFPGAPTIYYGNELGMEGGLDPDCRRGFPPNESQWDRTVFDYHKALISIRNQYSTLRTGAYSSLSQGGYLYVFGRGEEADPGRVIIAVNGGDRPEKATVEMQNNHSKPQKIVYGRGSITYADSDTGGCTLTLELPPRQGLILGASA
ncbi:MAG: glycoside hydrolase family 13 protein [Cyanophyceae cyanobacterium]